MGKNNTTKTATVSSTKRENRKQAAKKLVGQLINPIPGLEVANDMLHGRPVSAIIKGAKSAGQVIKTVGKLITGNHPEWYTNYPEAKLVNVNLAENLGAYMPEDRVSYNPSSANSYTDYRQISRPLAIAYDLQLTFPTVVDGTDHHPSPGYQAGIRKLYNDIRSANAGAINYDMTDLAHYVWTVRALHATFSIVRRAYATLRNFSATNSKLPVALFQAMGLDYESFRKNAADLKMFGSLLAVQLREIAPLNLPLFDRTDWLFSNFFADSDDAKSTYHVFGASNVLQFSDNGTPYNTSLAAYNSEGGTHGMPYALFVSNVNDIVSRFSNSTKFATIAGDIIKTYGESAIYKNVDWDENMATPIIYDEAALSQIQNMTIVSFSSISYNGAAITVNGPGAYSNQKKDNLPTSEFDWSIAWSSVEEQRPIFSERQLNWYKDDITSGEVMSATRLVTMAKLKDDSVPTLSLASVGTESCTRAYFIAFASAPTWGCSLDDTIIEIPFSSVVASNYDGTANITSSNLLGSAAYATYVMQAWSCMDWAPRIDIAAGLYAGPSTSYIYIFMGRLFDYNNVAHVDISQVQSYHSIADMSLLYARSQLQEQKVTAAQVRKKM